MARTRLLEQVIARGVATADAKARTRARLSSKLGREVSELELSLAECCVFTALRCGRESLPDDDTTDEPARGREADIQAEIQAYDRRIRDLADHEAAKDEPDDWHVLDPEDLFGASDEPLAE